METTKIGQFISETRKRKGLTQNQLANMLYVSDKTVSKWECGKGFPEISLLFPLCNALEITVNELLSGEMLIETDYKKKAEENMMLLIKEREERRSISILRILEEKQISEKIKNGDLSSLDFKSNIDIILEISAFAMNNGLFEINKYLESSNISPFLKKLIIYSTASEKMLSNDEFFELFAEKIIVSNYSYKEVMENIIYLQGYMYILQGDTPDIIGDKLSLLLEDCI